MASSYVTSSIPYVNAHPHLGHALEVVQADVLARHRRLRGHDVRALTGTDDHALKNVRSAREQGIPTRTFVDANAERFRALTDALGTSFDDFIRTSADTRHRPGVERLWRACAASGNLYRRHYKGRYCVGCEEFVDTDRCPEHDAAPEEVSEENWFFRLSRYEDRLRSLIEDGALRIEPEPKRNEVLGFLRTGLRDFSVSRSAERADGWGIPVPGDPTQVVYVWFDALANYINAIGYGTDDPLYPRWWISSAERVHVIGKGILRFHAVYWPAILLSAGEPLPTTIFVHDYLTANGQKLSKSAGHSVDPFDLVQRYGAEAVRWWLLSDVPRVGDADFTEERLVQRHNDDLANGIGNLVHRTTTLRRHCGIETSAPPDRERLSGVDEALARFDIRSAVRAIGDAVDEANRYVETTRPWELEGGPRDEVLADLWSRCWTIGCELEPFLPSASARLRSHLRGETSGEPPFPRLGVDGVASAP